MTTTHLARARATQREAQLPVFDQPMHFIEQRRHLLHFVDHHLPYRRARVEFAAQQLRTGHVAPVLVGLQQVDPERVRKCGG
jgi:hypothetical protein